MNILFISFNADPPHKGGTSTVVHVLAKYFLSKGNNVALGYIFHSDHPSTFFKEKCFISKENNEYNIRNFFDKNKFDIIYNVFGIDTDWTLINKYKGKALVISAYHNQPRINFPSFRSRLISVLNSKDLYSLVKSVIYCILQPFHKYKAIIKSKKGWESMVLNSDKILLLSNNYSNRAIKICPSLRKEDIIAIPNPVVFDKQIHDTEFILKKKVVLVVSSMNYQKRGLEMFSIWKSIEADSTFSDWEFWYVGEKSTELTFYKRLIRLWRLKRIKIFPEQSPLRFYKEASIFMMTSRYEGWPMVLMEAMQMRVVPIVYDSFEAVSDIFDNSDACIIKDLDRKSFINHLKRLMSDSELRKSMSEQGLINTQKFTIEKIGEEYLNAFKNLIEDRYNTFKI